MGFHRAAASVFVGAALAASACGGKLLDVPDAGSDAAGLGDDGSGGSGDDAPSSNGGCQGGCSSAPSSSSGAGASSASSGGSTASSSSGGGIACASASGCPRGEVCCGALPMNTACQVGPCPSTPLGPIQLCTTPAECLAPGDTCGPLAAAPQLPIKVCNAPTGAATCAGCIDLNGACVTGGPDTACGTSGATCVDCTKLGSVCNHGSCEGPAVDAGGPRACTVSACPANCIPIYQAACCKTDGSCGCKVVLQQPDAGCL